MSGNSGRPSPSVAARSRAVTLIEAVLFISIALGLIVGGIVFYQQASLTSRVGEQARVLSAIVTETRAMYQNTSLDQLQGFGATPITEYLIAANAVPSSIIAAVPAPDFGSRLRNEWGGELEVGIALGGAILDQQFVVLLTGVPVGACSRLLVADASGASLFTNGVAAVMAAEGSGAGLAGDVRSAPISPTDAGDLCSQFDPGTGIVPLIGHLIMAF